MNLEVLMKELLSLISNKKELIKAVLDLTKTQQQLILADDEELSEIQSVIEAKQSIINQIDGIDASFIDKYSTIKDQLGINSLEDLNYQPVPGFGMLKSEVKEVLELLKEIKLLDEANTQNAKANLDKVKEQLKVINVGKKATNSYSTSKYQQNHSILIDKKK